MTISLKVIDAAIASFSTDANALNNRAHDINVMILRHMAPKACGEDFQGTGDCTRVPVMIMAMPASWRRTSEIEWWTKNTPVRVKFNNGQVSDFGFDPKYKKLSETFKGEELEAERLKFWNVENALNEPFYTLAEKNHEKENKAFDLAATIKMIEGVRSKIEKNIEEGNATPSEVDELNEVKASLTRLVGLATLAKARIAVANNDDKPESSATPEVNEVADAMLTAASKAA